MDIVAASPEPSLVHDASTAKLAVASHVPDALPPLEPLEFMEEDNPKIRTKLRLYAILAALYVALPSLLSLAAFSIPLYQNSLSSQPPFCSSLSS